MRNRPPQLARAGILLGCLFLLVPDAFASKCITGCHGKQTGKAYQEGHMYIYDFEGTSVTSVSEAQGDATLNVKATVELSVKPDCVHQVRVKNLLVNGGPVSSQNVEQSPLQFNYHDGHIDTELCAAPGDSQASLNIKRAVISMFQSAIMQDSGSTTHHETDVFGTCPTEFSFHKEGESLVVQKYRDLSQCSHRETINEGLISANFDTAAGVKSSPLLSSQQKVEQRFKRGILNKAVSTETYKFKPFSNGDAGAKTVVESTIVLKGDKAGNGAGEVSLPKSLIFEAPHPVTKSSVDAISNALKAVKTGDSNTVQEHAATKFIELVKLLRVSNKNDILSTYHKVRAGAGFDKHHHKNVFLSALFRAGSGESVEVAAELIKNKEISGVQTYLFYASLALVQHVNLPSIATITSLLDQPDLPRIGYLGVGQIVGRYCQQHTCEDVPEIKEAIRKIRDKVGNGKTKTREQENIVVSALKALGNTRFLDDGTLQKLAGIASDKNVRNRVRVAAIEALPTRCSMKWKNPMMKVLADREEDSEVRIKTYLSLVACPCPHVANNLKEILDKETVNQVGSFITTHLRNLRASTDPSKQDAKRQLGLIKPRTKFPEDFRKFSFNNELSYYIDAFGVGSMTESNVIYSQNSFVPRSVSLNVSTEVFGRIFNFLEVDTRIENLDRVVEHYFGPKGEITAYEADNITSDAVNTVKEVMEEFKQRLKKTRGRREVKQGELDKFAKNVRLRGTEVDQDLDIDFSMKLFGVELAYFSYLGSTNKLSPKQLVTKFFDSLEKGFQHAKNFEHQIENHLYFLDSELVYPTGLGVSLSLGATGASIVHVKAKGQIDFPAIMKDPKNAAFNVAVEPSASITVNGQLMSEIFGIQSGMKVVMTLHTSTSSDVHVKVLNGKGIDVNFGIPKKKQEVISLSSEVFFTSGPKGDKYVTPKFPKGKEYLDCFDQFSGFLGLTVCGQISFPYESIESVQKRPLFPLSGPAVFSATVENNDISSYHFRAYYNDEIPDARSLEILLDTPNSRTSRRIALVLEGALRPNKYVKVSFDSPIKTASAEALLMDTPQEKTLTITLKNDLMEYFGKVGLMASGSKYKPVLEYKVPDHIEKLSGTKSGPRSQQYNVQGTVDVSDYENGKKFVFDKVVLTAAGRKVVSVDGSAAATPNRVMMDMKLGYGEENLAVKLDGKKVEDNNYALALSAVPSKDPNVGFSLDWQYKKGAHEMDNKFVFIHGPDLNSEVNRLTLVQHSTYNLDPKEFEISTSQKLKYPVVNLGVKLEGKVTRKSVSGDLEFKYDKFNLGTELSAKKDMAKPGDYEVEFEAEVMANSLKLKSKRTVVDDHRSKFKNSLVLVPGGKYEADGVVTYDVSKNNLKVQLDGELKLNGKSVQVDTGVEATPQFIDSKCYITVDGTKYIEFMLKGRKTPNPNGDLRLNLKNYLSADGHFGFQDGKGNGHLNIDIPKLNRKVKATGDLAIQGTQHTANVEVLYDAEKDPNKRIKFSTVTDLTKTSVDTKNIIEILTHKLEVNAKSKLTGTVEEGDIQTEADVTLPNGRHIVYHGKRTSAKKDNKMDIEAQFDLTSYLSKGGKQDHRFEYQGSLKDFDRVLQTFQSKSEGKYINSEGKDVKMMLALKDAPTGPDRKSGKIEYDLSGSMLPTRFDFDFEFDAGKNDGSGKIASSLGKDFSVKGSSSYSCGQHAGQPGKISGDLEVHLPNPKLHHLKLVFSETLLIPAEAGGVFEASGSETFTYNNDKTIRSDYQIHHEGIYEDLQKGAGNGKITLAIVDMPPMTIGGSYKHDATGEEKKESGTVDVSYGNKDASLAYDTSYRLDLSSVDFNAKATTPIEKLRSIDLHLNHKRDEKSGLRKTDAAVTVDDKKYTLNSEIQTNELAPMMHIIMTCPKGTTELLSKFQKLGERHYTGEWKAITPFGFVVSDAKVNLDSPDDFVIDVNFDSDRMKHRKIHAEIANKPTVKTGRRVIVTVTSDGKNIVTGSTNYKRRDEDGKVIVEGNGSLKIGDSTRSSSFKYTRQQLTRETDGEVGVAMVLNANFGPSAIVGELKLSNKEVHVFNSYCEQSKDCAHFKLQSTLDTDQKTHMKHQITVEVDLKKFNVPAEFGLKTSTEYKEFSFDHTASLYLHSSKDKSQYTYQIYAHPKESAVILSLPTRELAAIATFDMPKSRQTGAYRLEASLYMDRKNRPNEKTSLLVNGDANIEKNSVSLNGEAKFMYPSQPKDMAVKGRLHYGGEHLLDANVDIDVFAKKSQKISVVAKLQRLPLPKGFNATGIIEVNSRGQQLKVDLKSHLALSSSEIGYGTFFSYTDEHQKPKSVGVLFSTNVEGVHLLVTGPNRELIRSDVKVDVQKQLQKITGETSILGNKPFVVNIEAEHFSRFSYEQYKMDNPNTKLIANGRLVMGQLAEIHADAYKDGTKKDLFHLLIHLDEGKFLKPDFGYNKDNIVGVIDYYRGKTMLVMNQIRDVTIEIMNEIKTELKDLLEHLKKAQPNVKPLIDYYQGELEKLKNELHADQTIKEIQATLNKHFGSAIAAITETMKQILERVKELQKQYAEILSKISEALQAVYPQLKDSYYRISDAFMGVADAAANLGMAYVKQILNIINEHQNELKRIMVVVSEFLQDFAQVTFKGFTQMKKELDEFMLQLMEQVKALPIYEIIKEKYGEVATFHIPEAILNPLEDLCSAIENMLPTQELRELFTVTYQYILKHVKGQKVDDAAELKKIYQHAANAVRSLIAFLDSNIHLEKFSNFLETRTPIDLGFLAKVPGITSLKISLLNLVHSNELPSVLDIYYAYRPTRYLEDIVPPFSKTGIVADGGYIFTFDGRQLTFSGSCHYVLAQDMRDGNFSVIANFNNGNLVSITVTEPKESITLKNNGQVLMNNKPADFPASTKNLHAFVVKTTHNIKSDYGVHVMCMDKLHLCMVRVSGYYIGKLRGLFGDANNEPYDDYTLPSGKITEDQTEFANAYKLKADCPAATAADYKSVPRSPVCTDYFSGYSSPMSSCFKFVDPARYRQACDYSATKGPDGPCLIAGAYYAACYRERVGGISVPSTCVSCKVGGKNIAIGDAFSVKIPTKEADVVFVVEQDVKNEKVFKDLVTPLIADLREELKHQGITDVHIGLIGYNEKMEWPQHYTLNGNDNIEGEVKHMKFEEIEPTVTLQEAKTGDLEKKLTYIGERLDVELGTFELTDAYEEAVRYNFRPGAAKAVVGVITNPCEKSPLPLSFQHLRLLLGQKIYRDYGLTYYHVSFANELLVSGKQQKNIVGYDQDHVYTFADSKKKPLGGNSEMKDNLVVSPSDVCADFAVSSGGAAFSSNNFLDAKPNQKKQFAQVAARRIAEGLTSTEIQQDCVCQQYHGFLAGRSQCKIVGRKEKSTRQTKSNGVKG